MSLFQLAEGSKKNPKPENSPTGKQIQFIQQKN